MINRLNRLFFLITWCFAPVSILHAQEEGTPYFMHLTEAHGVSIQRVTDIAFDHLGFAWIASSDGLYRFDGHRFDKVNFLEKIGTPEIDNVVENIVVDQEGTIWFAVRFYGVYTYRYDTGKLTKVADSDGKKISQIKLDKSKLIIAYQDGEVEVRDLRTGKSRSITFNTFVQCIELHGKGGIWVGTSNGLFQIDEDYSFKKVELAIDPVRILRLVEDQQGNLWLGSERQGVVAYNIETKQYQTFNTSSPIHRRLESDIMLSLFLDSRGNIWASTDGGGVAKINIATEKVVNYNQDPLDHNSLTSKSVMCVTEDRYGNFWMGNNFGGVNVLVNQSRGVIYSKGAETGQSYRILSLLKDSRGNTWAGTDGEGLVLHYGTAGKGTRKFSKLTDPGMGNYIQNMIELSNGNLLIGTYDYGLSYFDYQTKKIRKIETLVWRKQKINIGGDIRSMFQDRQHRIWLGTEEALYVIDQSMTVLKIFDYQYDLSCGMVNNIAQYAKGQIIVGTIGGGLSIIAENLANPKSFQVKYNSAEPETFPYDVNVLRLDLDGTIWIGTQNYGLFYIEPGSNLLKRFQHEAFRNLHISSLEITLDGHLWISTIEGLYEWDGEQNTLNSYPDRLSIISYYLKRASYKDKNNQLYFGGINGFYKIQPDKLSTLPRPVAEIYFTQLFVNNSDETLNRDLVGTSMEYLDHVELDYKQSNFTIGYTALGQLIHDNYILSHRLSPFDTDWKYAGEDRLATYTNLPPGNYTFKVRLKKESGRLIREEHINVTIFPPWWYTDWAYALFVFIGLSLLFLSYRYTYQWAKLKNQWKYEKLTREKEKEINNMKLDFFTKMSHEIRTPLALILGPIERLKEMIQGNYRASNYISVVQSNAHRLLNLTEQILDLRKNETGELQLRTTNQDISTLLNEIIASFGEVARQKDILFEHHFPDHVSDFWYDHEKIEHILFNLLSNAFKYCNAGGTVKLILNTKEPSLDYQKGELAITVSDTGIGMDENTLQHVFDMFYRSDRQTEAGHGVGLALTRELVKLHKGQVEVSSEEGVGTAFVVRLHLGDSHLTEHEKVYHSFESADAVVPEKYGVGALDEADTCKEKLGTVLLVEDNPQMLDFIRSIFQDTYHVLMAENGLIGLNLAKTKVPDVIISDVLMPEMDGFEMTHHIKNNSKISHIPVLLLTARTTGKHTIEGLEIGADDYMTKPFQVDVLKLKVKNLLETKESAERFIRKELISEPAAIEARDEEEEFLQEVMRIINQHMSDPELKVEMIAREMSVSHSVLYRRCLAVTGQTVVDIIKITRLKTAAELITTGQLGISEAAYQVGFNDAKYFTKCFKNYFGKTPSKYVLEFKSTREKAISQH